MGETVRDVKDLKDWADFLIFLLALLGVVIGSVAWSLVAILYGVAVVSVVALARGGFFAWRTEMKRAAALDEKLKSQLSVNEDLKNGLRTAQDALQDPTLDLQVVRRVRSNGRLDLSLECTNAGGHQIEGLVARIIGLSVWTRKGWTEREVGSAEYLRWDVVHGGRTISLGAGSSRSIYVVSWRQGADATMWRWRGGPAGGETKNPGEELHYVLSELHLSTGGVCLKVAFEATKRRTQNETLCLWFAAPGFQAKRSPVQLRWIDLEETLPSTRRRPPLY
jgi:hypothetical protein